jgi:hypothetical protein
MRISSGVRLRASVVTVAPVAWVSPGGVKRCAETAGEGRIRNSRGICGKVIRGRAFVSHGGQDDVAVPGRSGSLSGSDADSALEA